MKFQPADEQLACLKKGVAEIIREEELLAKLEASAKAGAPLRVYLGVDPTAPDIHLGHTVALRKLKQFQDLGHTAIFLIGDFSAMIGDPSGQSETRPLLSRGQVQTNSETYLGQVYKILDRGKTEVRYNSEWWGKMSAYDVVRLCGRYRLSRMLEREDFRSRLENNAPLSVHELLYPLLTALDAVELKSDVELGATEQKLNILIHREIQREYGLPGEVVVTMPILVGLDGQRKMSKSLGNYVGIAEDPGQMFGKLMSIPDDSMWSYYELLTDLPEAEIRQMRQQARDGSLHPMEAKIGLARAIVGEFHGEAAAAKAASEFHRVFQQREAPAEAPVFAIATGGTMKLSALLFMSKLAPSRAEAERLIKQGAVEIEGQRIPDVAHALDLSRPREFLLRAGKKSFRRIVVQNPRAAGR